MARIGINGTAISSNGKGVSNYQQHIVEALSELDSKHEYFVFLNRAHHVPFSSRKQNWHFIPVSIWNHFFWEQFQLPYFARKFKLDLFHNTSDRFSILLHIPSILFLFEIPHHRYNLASNGNGKSKIYHRVSERLSVSMFPRSLKQAKCVLVSSHCTKKDLVERFRVEPEKIQVNYPGCENFFKPLVDERGLLEIRKRMGAPEGYILHFATGDLRENTETVIRSFKAARERLPKGLKLILAGGGANVQNDSKNIICLPFLTGDSLVQVYQGAKLYVDPSSYEGFGFQIVEAMACGVPVIASNKTCIPEIVGDAGILLDPEDRAGLTRSIVRILADENLWDQMRQKGLVRAGEFSWNKTARETLHAYEEILGEKQRMGIHYGE